MNKQQLNFVKNEYSRVYNRMLSEEDANMMLMEDIKKLHKIIIVQLVIIIVLFTLLLIK